MRNTEPHSDSWQNSTPVSWSSTPVVSELYWPDITDRGAGRITIKLPASEAAPDEWDLQLRPNADTYIVAVFSRAQGVIGFLFGSACDGKPRTTQQYLYRDLSFGMPHTVAAIFQTWATTTLQLDGAPCRLVRDTRRYSGHHKQVAPATYSPLAFPREAEQPEHAPRIEAYLAPACAGQITARDLITARAVPLRLILQSYSDPAVIFYIGGSQYSIALRILDNTLFLERCGEYVSCPLSRRNAEVRLNVVWTTDCLKLVVAHPSEAAGPSTVYTREIAASPTVPPIELIVWARQRALAPVQHHQTPQAFWDTASDAILQLEDKCISLNWHNAFWDIHYNGRKILSRTPKKEPDIQPTIHAALYDLALAKSYEINAEPLAGSGQIDFLLEAPLATGGIAKVCVEVKLAHSSQLFHGITSQLPTYMRSRGATFGIYLVLYFRCAHFDSPTETKNELLWRLANERDHAGLHNIRPFVLDVTARPPPSAQGSDGE